MKICPACRFDRCDDTADRCRQCGADLTEDEVEEEHAALAAAWFHYLEVPTIGTLELIPGQAFTLGREPRNNMVLPRCPDAELVRIYWSDDYDDATVQLGHGATSHLKVDGTRVGATAKRTLRGGEEIEVGGLRLKYLKRGQQIQGAIALKKLKGHNQRARRGVDTGARVQGGGKRRPGDLRKAEALDPSQRSFKKPSKPKTRRIATVRPAALVRALEERKAVGTLRVRAGRERGYVTIQSGKPQHAAFGERTGHEALATILRLGPCVCQLDPGLPKRGAGAPLGITFTEALTRIQRAATRQAPRPNRGAPPPRRPPKPPHRRTQRKSWPR